MTRVWLYTIGEANGRDVEAQLRQAGIDSPDHLHSWKPLHSDRDFSPGTNVLLLCAGDWRRFQPMGAKCLALLVSSALRKIGTQELPARHRPNQRLREGRRIASERIGR